MPLEKKEQRIKFRIENDPIHLVSVSTQYLILRSFCVSVCLSLSLSLQFYGSGSRPRFYDLFRLVHRQRLTIDRDDVLEGEEYTARRRAAVNHHCGGVELLLIGS